MNRVQIEEWGKLWHLRLEYCGKYCHAYYCTIVVLNTEHRRRDLVVGSGVFLIETDDFELLMKYIYQ